MGHLGLLLSYILTRAGFGFLERSAVLRSCCMSMGYIDRAGTTPKEIIEEEVKILPRI